MTRTLKMLWKPLLLVLPVLAVAGGIAFAVMTQVLKDVPAIANFQAGILLDSDSLAVSHDLEAKAPVDGEHPLDFGIIPDFDDLRLWSPFLSQCVYVTNLSDQEGLGPATTLRVRVLPDDAVSSLGGHVELAKAEQCDSPGPRDASPLDEAQRSIAPGEQFRARVALFLDRSPGQGPFAFTVTFGGVGVADQAPAGASIRIDASDNVRFGATVGLPQPFMWQVDAPDGKTYTQMSIEGTEMVGSGMGLPGMPAVPLFRRLIGIPRGADVSVANFEIVEGPTLQDVNLYPVQPEPVDSAPGQAEEGIGEFGDFGDLPFEVNAEHYGTNAFYPAQVVKVEKLGRMRDLDVALVTVAAGQYNGATQEMRLFDDVSFELVFGGGSGSFLTKDSLSPFDRPEYFDGKLLNSEDLVRYVDGTLRTTPCIGSEYLIITYPDFRSAADDLAAWKRTKGISTRVVQTDAIVAAGDDADTQRTKIQQYVRDQFNDCLVRLSYVLLLGDAEHIPTWYRTMVLSSDGTEVVAAGDLDYALMNDGDLLPDLALGRIPVDTLTEAQIVVDKTVGYESSPPNDLGFYEDVSFASYFQCCRNDVPEQGTTRRGFIETAEFVRDNLIDEGYNVERIYTTDTTYHDDPDDDDYYTGFTAPTRYYDTSFLPDELRGPVTGFPWDGDSQDVEDALNDGRFLVLHRDHGGKNGWSKPSYNKSLLANLNNGDLLPVILSVNCASGLFDNETNGGDYNTSTTSTYFVERALRMSGGGAVGVIGDTRNSGTWVNNAITRGFFDAIFPSTLGDYGSSSSVNRLGDILNAGKMYMVSQVGVAQTAGSVTSQRSNHNLVIYHAFGDPTLELWTSNPRGILVAAHEILDVSTTGVLVQYPVEGAIITVLQEGLPLGRGIVKNGKANIDYILEANPDLDVTVSVAGLGDVSRLLTTITEFPLGDDLSVTAMEVSQGIQNLANDMPLVEDRRTLVRVYVRNRGLFGGDVSGVRARLSATRGGSALSPSYVYAQNNPLTVKADGGDRRNLDDSFWFYPPSSWRSGTITLTAEVNYDNAVSDFSASNNTISETVSFDDAATFNAVLVPIEAYVNNNPSDGLHVFYGTESYRWDIYNNMYRLHPISDLDMWRFTTRLEPSSGTWNLSNSSDRDDMLARVAWLNSNTTDVASNLHYMGGVEAAIPTTTSSGGEALGAAYRPGNEEWVKMKNVHDGWPDWYLTGGNSMAHEMGHSEGRKHVNCSGSESGGGSVDSSYPYPAPDCHLADVDDEGYFGLDVYYLKWGFSEPAVIDNDTDAYPLMGYKRPRWIDPYTYCALLDEYGVSCSLTSFAEGSGALESVAPLEAPQYVQDVLDADRLVMLVGVIEDDGTKGRITGVAMKEAGNVFQDFIDEWARRHTELSEHGSVGLEVLDGQGNIVLKAPVDVRDGYDEHEDASQLFVELIPWPTGAVRLALKGGEFSVLQELVASPSSPTVSNVQGVGHQGTEETDVKVTWDSADQDPPPPGEETRALRSDVLYSPDGGETWRPMAMDVLGNEFLIPVNDLIGSSAGLFTVVVNDGFNTAQARATGSIVVPNHAPEVTVHSPLADSTKSGRYLVLDGSATDLEDGRLQGSALVWTSDKDGVLGTGEELALDVNNNEISRGTHEIKLTATDGDGQTGFASAVVDIQ